MRIILSLIMFVFAYKSAFTQSETAFEQYYFIDNDQKYTVMPIIYFRNADKWYAEARYNYEDIETFSIYFGKTFSKENKVSYSFTPILGAAIGTFNGISTGLTMELEYKKLFLSLQAQYSFATDCSCSSFFYNWSDLSYELTPYFRAGLSLQQTKLHKSDQLFEPGILTEIVFKHFSISVYTFAPLSSKRNFIMGLNLEWQSLIIRNKSLRNGSQKL